MSISCLVCLDNFEPTAEVVSINKCGHVFHLSCLNEWRYSKQSLSNTCPLCRKIYNKRSLTKLFLGVAEPEKDIKKDLQKLEEEKIREKNEKQKYINELQVVKTELGIKEQAYHIIDCVNNEYLQSNQKLKEQNERLLAESNRIREEMESLKRKFQPPPTVDLTSADVSDDEIQFVSATKLPKVIEGIVEINDDDDDDVQIVENVMHTKDGTNIQQELSSHSDESISNDFGHRIAPIETSEQLPISQIIQDIPTKNTSNDAILLDSIELKNEIKFEQPTTATQSETNDGHLTFGDIKINQQNNVNNFFLSTVDNNDPAIRKHKFEPELEFSEDFSFLRDFFKREL